MNQLRLDYDRRLAHRTGPDTSKQAAARIELDGTRFTHNDYVRGLVWNYPNLTSRELWAQQIKERLDLTEIRRRLNDLKVRGSIEVSGKRACKVAGTMAQTWRVATK